MSFCSKTNHESVLSHVASDYLLLDTCVVMGAPCGTWVECPPQSVDDVKVSTLAGRVLLPYSRRGLPRGLLKRGHPFILSVGVVLLL